MLLRRFKAEGYGAPVDAIMVSPTVGVAVITYLCSPPTLWLVFWIPVTFYLFLNYLLFLANYLAKFLR